MRKVVLARGLAALHGECVGTLVMMFDGSWAEDTRNETRTTFR